MKALLLLPVLAVALALVGCSKKEPPAPAAEVTATNETDQAEQPAEQPTEVAVDAPLEQPAEEMEGGQAADISTVPQSLQSADYDAAVDSLAAAGRGQMTPEQNAAYQAQLYRTLDALRQKAETDARAKQAYERMGKKIMGR